MKAITYIALLTAAAVFVLNLQATAKNLTVEEVLDNAIAVYADIENYEVEVHSQTFRGSLSKPTESNRPKILRESEGTTHEFRLYYKSLGKTKVGVQSEGKKSRTLNTRKRERVMFTYDPSRLFAQLAKFNYILQGQTRIWNHDAYVVELIPKEQVEGRDLKAILWIEDKNWTVVRVNIYLNGQPVLVCHLQYSKINGQHWLPVRTETEFPTQGKVIVNERRGYRINARLPAEIFGSNSH